MSVARDTRIPQALRLRIAGIPFAVLSHHLTDHRWLHSTYRQFVSDEAPRVRLAIRRAGGASLGDAGPSPLLQNGPGWSLQARHFRLTEVEADRSYEAVVASNAGIADLMRTWFSRVLLRAGGMLLHAAGVIRGEHALLVSGPSGSGKTTLARLAGRQTVLSDESVAILPGSAGLVGRKTFFAHGTPFFGEMMQAAANACAPIGTVFLIGPEHASQDPGVCRVVRVSPAHSAAALLTQTFLRTLSRDSLETLLPLVSELTGEVRVRRLEFTPVPGIWEGLDGLLG
jgi:hypothetical protein